MSEMVTLRVAPLQLDTKNRPLAATFHNGTGIEITMVKHPATSLLKLSAVKSTLLTIPMLRVEIIIAKTMASRRPLAGNSNQSQLSVKVMLKIQAAPQPPP